MGENRLLLVDCLLLLTKLKDDELCRQMVSQGLPECLLDFMCKYWNHSIMHQQIYKLFDCVLNSNNMDWIRGVPFLA